MAEDMVEVIARAIYFSKGPTKKPWSDRSPEYREGFYRQASSVLIAMREPTEAMIDAGYDRTWTNPTEAWQIMIDAALQKKERG